MYLIISEDLELISNLKKKIRVSNFNIKHNLFYVEDKEVNYENLFEDYIGLIVDSKTISSHQIDMLPNFWHKIIISNSSTQKFDHCISKDNILNFNFQSITKRKNYIMLSNNPGGGGGIVMMLRQIMNHFDGGEVSYLSMNFNVRFLPTLFNQPNIKEIDVAKNHYDKIFYELKYSELIIAYFPYNLEQIVQFIGKKFREIQTPTTAFYFVNYTPILEEGIRLKNNNFSKMAYQLFNNKTPIDSLVVLSNKVKTNIELKTNFYTVNTIQNLVMKKSFKETKERKNFIYVGRIAINEKNLFSFIEIGKLLKQESLQIHFYGFGPDEIRFMREIERNQLTDTLIFKGELDMEDVIEKISNYRALLLTSINEGTPNVILESYFAHTPVILFNTFFSADEIVKNNETGFLVEYPLYNDFVNRMLQINNDDDLFKKLQSNIIKWEENYNQEDILLEFIDKIGFLDKSKILHAGVSTINSLDMVSNKKVNPFKLINSINTAEFNVENNECMQIQNISTKEMKYIHLNSYLFKNIDIPFIIEAFAWKKGLIEMPKYKSNYGEFKFQFYNDMYELLFNNKVENHFDKIDAIDLNLKNEYNTYFDKLRREND